MFGFENIIADYILMTFSVSLETAFGKALHFFITDMITIFILLYASTFFISLFRSQLSAQSVEYYLQGKSKWYGYMLATLLGIITPFCSCSSIPLFMGFLASGIPFGVSMSFLISSPLVSEIAAIMLFGMEGAGFFVSIVYIVIGSLISVLAGFLCDTFNLQRFLRYKPIPSMPDYSTVHSKKERIVATIRYAHDFAFDIIRSTALYVIIGLCFGAIMYGYLPQSFFVDYLGRSNPFALPVAVLVGVPLYANHGGVVPIIQVLLLKGVPLGTALVVLMSVTALSLPELIILRRVFTYKLLLCFIAFLSISFIISGFVINTVESMLLPME